MSFQVEYTLNAQTEIEEAWLFADTTVQCEKLIRHVENFGRCFNESP